MIRESCGVNPAKSLKIGNMLMKRFILTTLMMLALIHVGPKHIWVKSQNGFGAALLVDENFKPIIKILDKSLEKISEDVIIELEPNMQYDDTLFLVVKHYLQDRNISPAIVRAKDIVVVWKK
jgi:hypothetical protein